MDNFHKRFNALRETLDDKEVIFDAVTKNLTIISAMAEHQKKELKLLRRQKTKIKESYDRKSAELRNKEAALMSALKELEYLKKKDEVFQDADKAEAELRSKIETLEAKIEGMQIDMDDYEFKNVVLVNEQSQFKTDLSELQEENAKLLIEQKRLTNKNALLEREVDDLKNAEKTLSTELMMRNERIGNLMDSLGKSETQNSQFRDTITSLKSVVGDKGTMMADLQD